LAPSENTLTQECGWKGGDRGALAKRQRDRKKMKRTKTLAGKNKTNS